MLVMCVSLYLTIGRWLNRIFVCWLPWWDLVLRGGRSCECGVFWVCLWGVWFFCFGCFCVILEIDVEVRVKRKE